MLSCTSSFFVAYYSLTSVVSSVFVSAFAAGGSPQSQSPSSSQSTPASASFFKPGVVGKNNVKTVAEWVDLNNNGVNHLSNNNNDVNPKKTRPMTPPRSGHVSWTSPSRTSGSSSTSDDNNDVYVFGGYAEENKAGKDGAAGMPHRYVTNDLWKYTNHNKDDGEGCGWVNLSSLQSGDIPQTRLASAAAALVSSTSTSSSVVLMGGWDPETAGTGGVILDDVHELNLETLRWIKRRGVKIPDGPTSRHVAVTLSSLDDETATTSTVMIHNHRCTDHVLLLKKKKNDNDSGQGEWTMEKQATCGQAPSPRGLHAATTFHKKNKVLLFGGAAQSGEMSNDVFVLDCAGDAWQWTPITCHALNQEHGMPSPRASPCLVALDDGIDNDNDNTNHHRFVMFGGAERSDEGGLTGTGDTWLLHLNDDENENETQTCAWWEKLCMSDGADDNANVCRPPGRNAATLNPMSISSLSTVAAGNANGSTGISPQTIKEHQHCFLLQGGWAPFRQTYNDNYVLKVTTTTTTTSL